MNIYCRRGRRDSFSNATLYQNISPQDCFHQEFLSNRNKQLLNYYLWIIVCHLNDLCYPKNVKWRTSHQNLKQFSRLTQLQTNTLYLCKSKSVRIFHLTVWIIKKKTLYTRKNQPSLCKKSWLMYQSSSEEPLSIWFRWKYKKQMVGVGSWFSEREKSSNTFYMWKMCHLTYS